MTKKNSTHTLKVIVTKKTIYKPDEKQKQNKCLKKTNELFINSLTDLILLN